MDIRKCEFIHLNLTRNLLFVLLLCAGYSGIAQPVSESPSPPESAGMFKNVACGTIATNLTSILVKNPHHPEPTYDKSICETVIERIDPSVNKLSIRFKQLELYRSTVDGECIQDRFAIYTDLNVPVTPVICGNQTGRTISIPFKPPHSSLIISVTTSDLDHDRSWAIEVEQGE